jgi:hypothetical protein
MMDEILNSPELAKLTEARLADLARFRAEVKKKIGKKDKQIAKMPLPQRRKRKPGKS